MERLLAAVDGFLGLEGRLALSPAVGFHAVIAQMHGLCAAIAELEVEGVGREVILGCLGEVRAVHALSPFVARLQSWPRGYPGDFETIEYLCAAGCGGSVGALGSVGAVVEWYALNSPIAQQHRNKVSIQADLIAEVVLANPVARVLVVGCGSAWDVRSIQSVLVGSRVELVLNDLDGEALSFVRGQLDAVLLERVSFVQGNVLQLLRRGGGLVGGFDLVLIGGVFDYLGDGEVGLVLRRLYGGFLRCGGRLVFSNVVAGNPFRVWMEFLADWHLVERDAQRCLDLCVGAGVPVGCVRMFLDGSGLARVVEVVKV